MNTQDVHTSPPPYTATSEALDTWFAWLRAGDLAIRTIGLRRTYINRLIVTVPNALEATEAQLVAYMDNPAWGNEAKRSALATLRSFYGWACRTDRIRTNPAEFLRAIRPKVRIPKPIPEPELRNALAAATREQEFMILLGAYAGLRREEICSVHGDDVSDLGLTIKGKGGQTRRVPIHPRLAPHLHGLVGYAFPSPKIAGNHVVGTYVRDRLHEVMPHGWSAHSLRHRFATATYAACKDILIVQQLLGHAKVETTLLYVLVEQDSLTNAVLAVA